jgi:hypothetical protein
MNPSPFDLLLLKMILQRLPKALDVCVLRLTPFIVVGPCLVVLDYRLTIVGIKPDSLIIALDNKSVPTDYIIEIRKPKAQVVRRQLTNSIHVSRKLAGQLENYAASTRHEFPIQRAKCFPPWHVFHQARYMQSVECPLKAFWKQQSPPFAAQDGYLPCRTHCEPLALVETSL